MKTLGLITVILISLVLTPESYAKSCQIAGYDKKALITLKSSGFVVDEDSKRNKLALALLTCLNDSEPEIRDGVVYGANSYWLRNKLLTVDTTIAMFQLLTNTLAATNTDQHNFTQPFAALLLSEVVRVDRVSPYLSNTQRQQVVDISTSYMEKITDYRGFDNKDGWRHATAHTSDIFLQLALNKQISKTQLNQMLHAIERQLTPSNYHFYIYGEPKRFATAWVYILLRGLHSENDIKALFDNMLSPAPFDSWQNVYSSNQGLSKLHNLRQFIYSLKAITGESKNPRLQQLQPYINSAIKQLG